MPSFGLSCQWFFPKGMYLDLYNLNARPEDLWITHFTASWNFAFWRLGLAVGYTYNSIAGTVYHGPSAGISLWL